MTGVVVCCGLHDAPFAEQMERELRRRGFQTFPMSDANDGFSSLERADAVIFLLGRDTLDDERVRGELEHARSLRKPMVGILVEDDLGPNDIDRRFGWLWSLLCVQLGPHDSPFQMVDTLAGEGFEWARLNLRLDIEEPPRKYPDLEASEPHEPAYVVPGDPDTDFEAFESHEPCRPSLEPDEDLQAFEDEPAYEPPSASREYVPEWPAPASAEAMARASEQAIATEAGVVDCSVFAPDACAPGTWIFVQAYFHTPKQAPDAVALAQEFDPGTSRRGFAGLQIPISHGCILDVELDMKGARVEEPIQRHAWHGRAEAVQFDVQIAVGQAEGPVRGSVVVRKEGIPIGRVGFRVMVAGKPSTLLPSRQVEDPVRFSSAFISYASPDRDEVLRRVQGIQAAGIAFFQDVLALTRVLGGSRRSTVT